MPILGGDNSTRAETYYNICMRDYTGPNPTKVMFQVCAAADTIVSLKSQLVEAKTMLHECEQSHDLIERLRINAIRHHGGRADKAERELAEANRRLGEIADFAAIHKCQCTGIATANNPKGLCRWCFVRELARPDASRETEPIGIQDPVFIWSSEHDAYWRPDGKGYTADRVEAGIYERKEAAKIIAGSGPEKRLRIDEVPKQWRFGPADASSGEGEG